ETGPRTSPLSKKDRIHGSRRFRLSRCRYVEAIGRSAPRPSDRATSDASSPAVDLGSACEDRAACRSRAAPETGLMWLAAHERGRLAQVRFLANVSAVQN